MRPAVEGGLTLPKTQAGNMNCFVCLCSGGGGGGERLLYLFLWHLSGGLSLPLGGELLAKGDGKEGGKRKLCSSSSAAEEALFPDSVPESLVIFSLWKAAAEIPPLSGLGSVLRE